jgi:hypothetical protein
MFFQSKSRNFRRVVYISSCVFPVMPPEGGLIRVGNPSLPGPRCSGPTPRRKGTGAPCLWGPKATAGHTLPGIGFSNRVPRLSRRPRWRYRRALKLRPANPPRPNPGTSIPRSCIMNPTTSTGFPLSRPGGRGCRRAAPEKHRKKSRKKE